jgi:hypothetical protein
MNEFSSEQDHVGFERRLNGLIIARFNRTEIVERFHAR